MNLCCHNQIIGFDFDGTIVDSEKNKQWAMMEFIVANTRFERSYVKRIVGGGISFERAIKLVEEDHPVLDVLDFRGMLEEKLNSALYNAVMISKPVDGCLELLFKLSRSEANIFCISLTPNHRLQELFKDLDLFKYNFFLVKGVEDKVEAIMEVRVSSGSSKEIIYFGDKNSDQLVCEESGVRFWPVASSASDFNMSAVAVRDYRLIQVD